MVERVKFNDELYVHNDEFEEIMHRLNTLIYYCFMAGRGVEDGVAPSKRMKTH